MDVDIYKTCILAAFASWSVPALFAFDRFSGATLSSFPSPFGYVFVVALLLTSSLSLYGIVYRRTVLGLLWERSGQAGLGLLFMTYGSWAWASFGERAAGFGWLLIFLGVAAILRVIQIEWRRRTARKAAGRGTS